MKSHYHVLDGLRGTAAFSVFTFHILEMLVPSLELNPMPHTFLAVDFFFALSGFILGHAYDARMCDGGRLAPSGFFMRRLIRLHPMVLVAMVVGVLGYLFDPFAGNAQRIGPALSPGMLLLTFCLSLLLLPAPTLPNYFGETHPVNGPSWTLLQEYIANVLYALFASRLGRKPHIVLCCASALALLWTAKRFGNLGYGWGWDHYWVAPVRLACPFLLGLLVYRMKLRIALPHPYAVLSLALVAVFAAPVFRAYNWLYEAVCVIVVFPCILMAGAGADQGEDGRGWLARLAGELSYPVYIVHYPFIYIFAHWNWSTHPSRPVLAAAGVGMYCGVTLFALALSRWYDRPLRAWLARVCLAREAEPTRFSPQSAS
ncbi:acyltransferase family protein [Pseudoduganella namucuonensis]|uniref:Peptidoglycan/LPS O-acetylase OafA/YrhL, contains acyltransferase and SGNH-hydrolase domains n=1 Tax=Pseudoduganella namucuonensis TaxID=1035707 RepID=A0A1I7LHA9_9BURK|nr:acyltransferase [Pseudoduganella namucuonensis]SFV09065.1 Peptidoglycan/LPS O-acetylase OafA/YrhL, contains acyltransferase and SGNH-hydrolase domains [Pseudoduganella namucuonensis]